VYIHFYQNVFGCFCLLIVYKINDYLVKS
jgi:hypothetical protein